LPPGPVVVGTGRVGELLPAAVGDDVDVDDGRCVPLGDLLVRALSWGAVGAPGMAESCGRDVPPSLVTTLLGAVPDDVATACRPGVVVPTTAVTTPTTAITATTDQTLRRASSRRP